MTRSERNTNYRENFDRYVQELVRFPDGLLEKKLELVQLQMALAARNRDEEVYETLSIWEKQIIEARILRDELAEKPVFTDEMAELMASIERVTVREIPVTSTEEELPEDTVSRKPKIREGDEGQMSLF